MVAAGAEELPVWEPPEQVWARLEPQLRLQQQVERERPEEQAAHLWVDQHLWDSYRSGDEINRA